MCQPDNSVYEKTTPISQHNPDSLTESSTGAIGDQNASFHTPQDNEDNDLMHQSLMEFLYDPEGLPHSNDFWSVQGV
jgi:hypothetical protein